MSPFTFFKPWPLFRPGWQIAPLSIEPSTPWNKKIGSISARLCSRENIPYIHTGWRGKKKTCKHAHMGMLYSHKTNTYSPATGSPQRGAVHTVFTALFNYWLVAFLLLWEATPYEQGERPAHKNCSRTLSFKPDCALLTSASLLNRTLAFLGTVSPARLLILSVFRHHLLFVSFILIFSPSFLYPLSHRAKPLRSKAP